MFYDLYFLEIMSPIMYIEPDVHAHYQVQRMQHNNAQQQQQKLKIFYHTILNFMPSIRFRAPKDYLYDLENDGEQVQMQRSLDANFKRVYLSNKYQCCCYYLKKFKDAPKELNTYQFYVNASIDDGQHANVLSDAPSTNPLLTQIDCLKILLHDSGLNANATWAELHNFVTFLNEQLYDVERSPFLNETQVATTTTTTTNNHNTSANNNNELSTMRPIFVNLLILMSYDFALPSLNIGEQSPQLVIVRQQQPQQNAAQMMDVDDVNGNRADGAADVHFDLNQMEITRRWERLTHPYVLFNADHYTFTFMGLYMDRRTYKFLDTNTNKPISDISLQIDQSLRLRLLTQRAPIFKNFNTEFKRHEKITSLRNVMGLNASDQVSYDPDSTYELTIDNCLKIMAIYMRFRCNIPVVVMGETGCGKTRLIKYLCDLHQRKSVKNVQQILLHVKVHGGTTAETIQAKLRQAERLSAENFSQLYPNHVATNRIGDVPASCILFFDEANTTDAIGLIKEIICDSRCMGEPIDFNTGLKIVAACNPYKRHTDMMIQKLEQAGLGFYKANNDNKEKLGHIPMRHLVYRVQPLPGSMLPLVWDFGQLNNLVERVYIRQMLQQAVNDGRLTVDGCTLGVDNTELDVLSEALTQSQDFMRCRNDECSFVSLRGQ
jgi:hypothetical protein